MHESEKEMDIHVVIFLSDGQEESVRMRDCERHEFHVGSASEFSAYVSDCREGKELEWLFIDINGGKSVEVYGLGGEDDDVAISEWSFDAEQAENIIGRYLSIL